MIRLGLRLSLAGGRAAAARLVIIAAAVALGTGLLLITLAGVNAVSNQNSRYGWLESGAQSGPAAPGTSALWWQLRADFYRGTPIGRLDLAATGPAAPKPPGLPRLPGPGQFYASPALDALLHSVPAGQLAARFPGHEAGIIGPAALPSPGMLLAIVGHTPGQLAHTSGVQRVTRIASVPPDGCTGPQCVLGLGINANGIDLILSVVALGLLLPVLVFTGASSRLAAAQREQRFAALRLAGATPRQVSVIAAVESALAAVAGTAAGFGVFVALRPPVAALPLTGVPFYVSDLSLSVLDVLAVAVGVPVAAALAALAALRRVRVSPLGVSRRVTPRPPRAWRVLPLLAGLAALAFFTLTGHPLDSQGQMQFYLPSFALILAGLVIFGPWVTSLGARLLARHARRPATLIAARRLSDNPRAAFRAISGLVLTLFVTTVALATVNSISANRGIPPGSASHDVVSQSFTTRAGHGWVPAVPGPVLARLAATPGVRGVLLLHTNPARVTIPDAVARVPGWGPVPAALVSCAQLAQIPALGRCPAGAVTGALPVQLYPPGGRESGDPRTITWPAAPVAAARLAALPVTLVTVGTNGSVAATERARTILETAYPGQEPPQTGAESYWRSDITGWEQLADVLIVASLIVGGCTLAVSVAGSVTERQRPFSQLRLTGVPLKLLRRVVALESGLPLLLSALVAVGLGLLASALYLEAELRYSLGIPGLGYWLIVVAGLGASLGIIGSTLPLLRRLTGPEAARNE